MNLSNQNSLQQKRLQNDKFRIQVKQPKKDLIAKCPLLKTKLQQIKKQAADQNMLFTQSQQTLLSPLKGNKQQRLQRQYASSSPDPSIRYNTSEVQSKKQKRRRPVWLPYAIVLGFLITSIGVLFATLNMYPEFYINSFYKLKDFMQHKRTAPSGFLAASALLLFSEIGDKTFFICSICAAEFGSMIAFTGTMMSLTVMTVLSVCIGIIFKKIPGFLNSSAPVVEQLSSAMLLFFGIRSIWKGLFQAKSDEKVEAEGEVQSQDRKSDVISKLGQVFALIFLAEWGDRSMLATVALATMYQPVGVTFGAIVGHGLASVIAVIGGNLASKFISERFINMIGGIIFIAFAFLYYAGVLNLGLSG